MKLSRWLLPVALIAGFVWLQGCKKEEDPEYEYMDGVLTLVMPPYVEPGFTKTFMIDTLMTVSRPDGGKVGYAFKDPDTGKRDTLVLADGTFIKHHYTLTVADKLEKQTLTLYAFTAADDNYYGSTASVSFTIVRPGVGENSSITNFRQTESTLEDPRDGRIYYIAQAGGLDWMRQNLAWPEAGHSYQDCPAMTDVMGRYYTWEEAQNACPDGWRLPSEADWAALGGVDEAGKDIPALAGKMMGNLYFNGVRMWEYWPEVKITDELLLSAMPAGYATLGEGAAVFSGSGTYAVFWTSDESEDMGICRYIYQDKDIVYRGRMPKDSFAASVRCVKE